MGQGYVQWGQSWTSFKYVWRVDLGGHGTVYGVGRERDPVQGMNLPWWDRRDWKHYLPTTWQAVTNSTSNMMDSFRSGQKENNTKIFLKNQEETVRTNQFYLTICINQKLYELFIILNIKILKHRMQQTHRHTNIGGTHAHITHGSLSRDTFLGKHSSNIVLPLSENSPKKQQTIRSSFF